MKDTAKHAIKVCIIDDHSVVRMGLKYMLSYIDDVECVGEASGGEGAAAFVRGCGADITLPDAEEDIYRAVTMGAKGYLLKESDPNRLLEAIRTVAAGGTCLPEELKRVYDARAAERGLTSRESEILRYIAKGYSNEEIADMVHLSLNTVKTHVKSILANLNVSDRAEAVAEGIHRGIIA